MPTIITVIYVKNTKAINNRERDNAYTQEFILSFNVLHKLFRTELKLFNYLSVVDIRCGRAEANCTFDLCFLRVQTTSMSSVSQKHNTDVKFYAERLHQY